MGSSTASVRIALYPVGWTDSGDRTGTAWFDDVSFTAATLSDTVRGSWLISQGPLRVWSSPVEQKVRRDAILPGAASWAAAVTVSAAQGEYEEAQLVLLPEAAGTLIQATMSDLTGPRTAVIPASAWVVR